MRDDNNSAEKSKKKYGFVERILLLLPPTIFLIFTFAIYMPSSLFISNIDDFALDYIKVVPLIALVSVAVLVIVYIIGLIIPIKRFIIFDFGCFSDYIPVSTVNFRPIFITVT